MNRYPAWKNAMIAFVIALGALFALPNIYGEDPAVQVSGTRGRTVNNAVLEDVQDALQQAVIEYVSADLDQERLLVRFADPDTQLRGQDVIRVRLGDDYTVALNLAPSTPDWLRALGAGPMVLGLDLRGGVHFLMEVDMVVARRQQQERFVEDLRSLMQDERIRYVAVTQAGDGIRVQLRSEEDRDAAMQAIETNVPDLSVEVEDAGDGYYLRYTVSDEKLQEIKSTALQQNIVTLRNRVNELGVAEPIVQQQGSERIVVQLPGVQDTAEAKKIIGSTATLEYRLVDMRNDPYSAQQTGRIPAGFRMYKRRDTGGPVLLSKRIIVSGDQLVNATSGFDQRTGTPAVFVTLNGAGARKMSRTTAENVGSDMAVVLIEPITKTTIGPDGEPFKTRVILEEVISVATINEPFGRRFQTTGGFSPKEAQDLALLLRAGSLAAPVEIIEERTVGPSLGRDNIEMGFRSVVYGFVAVLVFMAFYYRVFGLIADLALITNLVLIVALLSLLGATLTLPGIAGIVLTVGMAVDANVLIFERIREELANGNTPQASINAGYSKALSTIADANITTLIAGVVLFTFGTGAIKGFAVTLSLGIITSMFTAIMGTRAVINLIYGRRRVEKLAI